MDDVTAPELVISGGNGGVKGHPGSHLCGWESVYIKPGDAHFLKQAQRIVTKQFLMTKYCREKRKLVLML